MESIRDLGVEIDSSFKFSKQAQIASKKANKILGLICRKMGARLKEVVVPLYQALVRPHLEYAVQFWRPFLKKDINLLEKVQRRATRVVSNLRSVDYSERLSILNLFSLERRRDRGDLIETFKILNGIDKIGHSVFELCNDSVTRGHNFKLRKPKCRTNARYNFFSSRVVNMWNALSHSVVNCTSVEQFKKKLDIYMEE